MGTEGGRERGPNEARESSRPPGRHTPFTALSGILLLPLALIYIHTFSLFLNSLLVPLFISLPPSLFPPFSLPYNSPPSLLGPFV